MVFDLCIREYVLECFQAFICRPDPPCITESNLTLSLTGGVISLDCQSFLTEVRREQFLDRSDRIFLRQGKMDIVSEMASGFLKIEEFLGSNPQSA